MKTTKIYWVACLMFLLTQFNVLAQYNGGVSDGAAVNEISLSGCSTPSHFYAYFGGVNDGANVGEFIAATCGTAAFQFAYMGGTADGAATEELNTTACSIPPSFFAYMGGNNDGAGVETFEQNVCAFPPQFYAYFGGDGDGFTLDKTTPICPTEPPVASFTASTTSICVGESVTFTDTSTNIPGAWTWTLPGGTPNSSIAQNPTVVYNTAGTYNVTLQAANFNGIDTKSVTNMIIVTAYPTVTGTTPGSRCDSGTVTLAATASTGTLNWYANPTGGSILGSGTSFTTPSISATTTYYVETANNGCSSARTAVVATVNTTPTITSTTPASRCDSGSVTLTATSSAGSTVWYALPSGGIALSTSNNFVTPSISGTTTYYVEALLGGCASGRTAVIATVDAAETIMSTTPGSRCDTGTVTLAAVSTGGTLNWYANASGGPILGTGTTFVTPSITSSTTYYVEVTNGTCTSSRLAVLASINGSAAPTGSANQSFCANGTVADLVTTSGTNIVWYTAAIGGTVVPNSTVLVSGTTYYASQNNGTCESANRLGVTVMLDIMPTVTSTTPESRCGSGVVTLNAASSTGTLVWYGVSTGGSVLGTGTNFSPGISGTTTYYVEAVNGVCTSTRTAVIATVDAAQTITSTTPGSRCDVGAVTLSAAATGGTLNWYNVSSGGSTLGTGSTFITPSISSSATYYVEVTNGTCTSSRVAVTASINPVTAPTGNTNQQFCAGETVGLLIISSGVNIVWYDAATGGAIVPNNSLLVSGTTYYASQNNGTCESLNRLAVTATLGTCLGTEEFITNVIKLYPNPVIDFTTISSTETITKIEVVNMLGQMVYTTIVNDTETNIDMTRYASGTYMVRVSADDKVKIFKVIKK